ncbi:MAG: AAA family ATPase [Vulcanisaeta sp.]|nr:AAA family ATPase [Vulcanisaeta sp.]
MVSNKTLRVLSRLFTGILYLVITMLAFIWDFPFYPIPIAALIIIVTTALAYSGHVKLGFVITILLLVPAILYVYNYAALGALLLILMLIVLIRVFDWLGIGVGMLAWELSIIPNQQLYTFSVPLILMSPSLTVGVTRRVTPLKSLITFLLLYIPTLLILNAGPAVVPWFGYVAATKTPLPSLTVTEVERALGNIDAGIYGLSQAIGRVFTWSGTYVLPPSMALAAYVAYVLSSRLRLSENRVLRFLAPAVGTITAYAVLTSLLFYLNPYFGLDQGVSINTLINGLPPTIIISLALLPLIMHLRLVEIRFEEEERLSVVALERGYQLILNKDVLRTMAKEWDEVVGLDDVKSDIEATVITPLKDARLSQRYGLMPIHGVLLFGPPGVGKTMLARAIAGRLGWTTIIMNLGELLSKYYGESENRLTELFKIARNYAPSVIIIDELDAIGKARSRYVSDDVTPRLLNILLSEMDGITKSHESVLVIGTTNQPDLLDPALLRPGRFDKVIYIPPPNEEARAKMFEHMLRDKPVQGPIDYRRLAKLTERFTGADIMNVIRTVLLKALREGRPITQRDLEDVISKYKPSLTYDLIEKYEAFRLQYSRLRTYEKPQVGIPEVSWEDIGDLEEVKALINKYVVAAMQRRDVLQKLGIEPIHGLLLFGPPGVGKTLVAKATANMLRANFIELNGAELARVGPERAAAIVKDVFNMARENAPAIIFIDEIDSVAPPRDSPLGAVWSGVVSQLLTEMDGLRELNNIIVIAATNRPWSIDPALLRPGRFDKVIYIPPPDRDARREILRVHLRGVEVEEGVIDWVADVTEGYSGADLAALVREAKMRALDRVLGGDERVMIKREDFEYALSRVKPSLSRELLSRYEEFVKKLNLTV